MSTGKYIRCRFSHAPAFGRSVGPTTSADVLPDQPPKPRTHYVFITILQPVYSLIAFLLLSCISFR
jgi:hypothetical protein